MKVEQNTLALMCISETLDYERGNSVDGWVHLAGDTGGVTMWGLSSANNPSIAKKIKDRTLTKAEAIDVYYNKYYNTIPLIHEVDPRMAFYLFDSKVHGAYTPIETLQKWLNNKYGVTLAEDGSYGPATARVVSKMTNAEVGEFFAHLKSSAKDISKLMAKRTMASQKAHGLQIVDFTKGFLRRVLFRANTALALAEKGDRNA